MWPYSMQIVAFGTSLSGKHCLFFCMLDVWGLTGMTDVWINEKLLAGIYIKVLDLLTKMYFAIQSVFISTYAIISIPQFSLCDIPAPNTFNHFHLTPILLSRADPSGHGSFVLTFWWYMPARSHSFAALQPKSWLFLTSMCPVIHSWMDYWMGKLFERDKEWITVQKTAAKRYNVRKTWKLPETHRNYKS